MVVVNGSWVVKLSFIALVEHNIETAKELNRAKYVRNKVGEGTSNSAQVNNNKDRQAVLKSYKRSRRRVKTRLLTRRLLPLG